MPTPMPSHTTFLSRASLLLIAIVLLGGCTAINESKQVFDLPLADDYKPIISRDKAFTPKRILVLPVFGSVDTGYRQIFETEMLADLRKPAFWTIVEFGRPGSGDSQLSIDQFTAYKKAQATGCDAILFVELTDHSVYDPIHFSATVTMDRTDNQTPALNSRFDYDTRNQSVADSARNYFQEAMSRPFGGSDAPDKSLYILHNNDPFFKFCGYYTARLLAETYQPPKQNPNSPSNSPAK